MSIREINGDITKIDYPTNGLNFIPQICNDLGKYGAGLSGALSVKWPAIAKEYHKWHEGQGRGFSGAFGLGEIQVIGVTSCVLIANLIAQKGVRSHRNPVPIQYNHLEACMIKLYGTLMCFSGRVPDGYIKIWCPRIGSGLAGGDWNRVQSIVSHWFNRPEFELYYVTL